MKIRNLEHALEVFEKKAVEHEKSTRNGESAKKINSYYNGIIEAVRWLYKHGELLKLKKFYSSSDSSLKSWAASFLIDIDSQNAVRVLEELAASKFIDAEYILMGWKDGTLDTDFYKK
jgi:hypothetical protein